ncbi:hypothetical protein ACHAXM_004476 [Skeletonema potamos]
MFVRCYSAIHCCGSAVVVGRVGRRAHDVDTALAPINVDSIAQSSELFLVDAADSNIQKTILQIIMCS